MGSRRTVIDEFREVFGRRPSEILDAHRTLNLQDMSALMSAHRQSIRAPEEPIGVREIWPLISHHTYDSRALFGPTVVDVAPRALTLLLIHNGLVVADPLNIVEELLVQRRADEALGAFLHATAQIANVEVLIDRGYLRMTRLRPSLTDAHRSEVLKLLGLTPDLRLFTDFLEAAVGVSTLPRSYQDEYIAQVQTLLAKFGIASNRPSELSTAVARVKGLAAAVIEMSWQFAVLAADKTADLAPRGPLEEYLAENIIREGMGADCSPGRHFSRLDLGGVPNVDSTRLSLSDALAIRADDSFSRFRDVTHSALDRLESDEHAGVPEYRAVAAFEQAMVEGSSQLQRTVRKASFGHRVRDISVPVALTAVSNFAIAPQGPIALTAANGAIVLTSVVWQWLCSRGTSDGHEAALRYYSMLGRFPG